MQPPSLPFLSKVALAILWLIIVRLLAEVFRLQYVEGGRFAVAQVTPYVGSALLVTVVLGVALLCHAGERYRVVVGSTAATVALLLVYKIAVLG